MRSKPDAGGLEPASLVAEVVDLAVVDDPERTVVGSHRLVACARQVEDRQPGHSQAGDAVDVGAPIVGAAVVHRVAGPIDGSGDSVSHDAEDAAHRRLPLSRPCRRPAAPYSTLSAPPARQAAPGTGFRESKTLQFPAACRNLPQPMCGIAGRFHPTQLPPDPEWR